jgi:hypothetical protein
VALLLSASEVRSSQNTTTKPGADASRQAGPQALRSPAQEKVNQGEKKMKATIENGELVIRLPLNKTPILSTSGKTLIIASTHGNQKTDAVVNGQPVVIGANAYIVRPAR